MILPPMNIFLFSIFILAINIKFLYIDGFHYNGASHVIRKRLIKMNEMSSFFNIFSSNKNQNSSNKREELKNQIISISANTDNGIKISPDNKNIILGLVKSLEAVNPTNQISNSKLLDGKWDLIYTTNTGSSAGKLGPFVGAVIQDISLANQEYDNIVNLFNNAIEASLTATWDVQGRNLWLVKFLKIQFKVFGIKNFI